MGVELHFDPPAWLAPKLLRERGGQAVWNDPQSFRSGDRTLDQDPQTLQEPAFSFCWFRGIPKPNPLL